MSYLLFSRSSQCKGRYLQNRYIYTLSWASNLKVEPHNQGIRRFSIQHIATQQEMMTRHSMYPRSLTATKQLIPTQGFEHEAVWCPMWQPCLRSWTRKTLLKMCINFGDCMWSSNLITWLHVTVTVKYTVAALVITHDITFWKIRAEYKTRPILY